MDSFESGRSTTGAMQRLRRISRSLVLGGAILGAAAPAHTADPVPAGAPILVDLTPSYHESPHVAVDPAGNFLVAWEDDYDGTVKAKAYYSTGNERGPIFEITSPEHYVEEGSFTPDELVSVAADGAGNFVVAFNAYDATAPYGAACTDSPCIWTRRYDVDGRLSPSTFIVGDPRINAYQGEPRNQTANPEIVSDGNGEFLVAWEGYDEFHHIDHFDVDEGVWVRKLVSSGQVKGPQFRANEITAGYQGDYGRLDLDADQAGNFTVVWQDENYDYPPYSGIVMRRFDASKNAIGVQVRVTSEIADDPRVALTPSGEAMVIWSDFGTVSGRVYDDLGDPVGPEFDLSTSAGYPEISTAGPSSFVVVWGGAIGVEGRLFDTSGAPISDEFTVSADGYYADVAGDAAGNFVVVWKEDGDVWGAQRFEVEEAQPQEIPLLGKAVVIANKLPDDFEKSKGKWNASGDGIVVPLRGSADDPRCNGDPEGTVKATVRFASATSGADTGAIPLPCQNWTATGSTKVSGVAKRGFKYSDGKLADGPCNSVKIKGTKTISVSCKGKKGAASFVYDLQVGVAQGRVVGSLSLGGTTYCAEFQAFFDGSDGKKYKGKAVATPASCS